MSGASQQRVRSLAQVVANLSSRVASAIGETKGRSDITYKGDGDDYTGVLSGYKVEVEARVRFSSSNQYYYWDILMQKMIEKEVPSSVSKYTMISYGTHTYRLRIEEGSEGEKIESVEDKISSVKITDDSPYWITYAISLEKVVAAPALANPIERAKEKRIVEATVSRAARTERKITRTSFFLSDEVRLDMSEVTMKNKIEYHIEVELLDQNGDLSTFVRYARDIVRMARGSLFLYSSGDVSELAKLVNTNLYRSTDSTKRANRGHIERSIFNEVGLLSKHFVRYGGIVGGYVKYNVRPKSHGRRWFMFISNFGIWFAYPPYYYNLVYPNSYDFVGEKELTVFDGEFIPKEKRLAAATEAPFYYQVFDCLMVSGQDIRDEPSLRNRIGKARDYISRLASLPQFPSTVFYIECVSYSELWPETFFETVERCLEKADSGELSYMTDGLIFTPTNTPYKPKGEGEGNRTLKWKSLEETTIDFKVKIDAAGVYGLFYDVPPPEGSESELHTLARFEGSSRNAFDPKKMINTKSLIENGVNDDSIIEMEWRNDQFQFKMRRDEKANPNRKEIVESNYDILREPFSRESLLGEDFELMFRYHSRVRSELFSQIKGGGVLLDLGSGKGGSLNAQKEFKAVICVEINEEYADELRMRARFLKRVVLEEGAPLNTIPRDTPYIVVMSGCSVTETERIKKEVLRHSYSGANVVSLIDVATFVWSEDELERTVDTIGSCLSANGTFVWKMMDGVALCGLMGEERAIDIGGFTVEMVDDREDYVKEYSRVRVSIPGSIVGEGQVEYVTEPRRMTGMLVNSYQMESEGKRMILNEEKLLSKNAVQVSSLYSCGTMTRLSNIAYPILIPEHKSAPVAMRRAVRQPLSSSSSSSSQRRETPSRRGGMGSVRRDTGK